MAADNTALGLNPLGVGEGSGDGVTRQRDCVGHVPAPAPSPVKLFQRLLRLVRRTPKFAHAYTVEVGMRRCEIMKHEIGEWRECRAIEIPAIAESTSRPERK